MCDAYTSCGKGDITFSLCHMTSRDHIVKGAFGFVELTKLSPYYTKFDRYRSCGSGDITFLFCHITSRDHMIKGTLDLVNESFSS